jgi:hypothetical protein
MRLIDADILKLSKVYSLERHEYVVPVAEIDWQSSVEAVPVVHARWIERMQDQCYCSNCNGLVDFLCGVDVPYHFCPHCGAIMDGKENG